MAVVGELVAGAALGTVFSELYGGVQKLSKSNKPLLDDLQITLDSLKPIVDEMRDCNDELDPSCKEIAAFHSKIEEGVKLVCKLSTVDKWYKTRTCIQQLVELNGSLKTHIKILTVPKLYDFIHLKNLSITNFHKLSTLPEEVGNLINLQVLRLNSCSKLSELPGSVTSLNKLNFLEISHCDSITELPEDIGNLINLEELRLNSCSKLAELPGSLTSLNKLNFLDISDCYSITELPEDIGNMSSLRKLDMTRCSKVNKLPLSVLYLDQLEGVVCDEETKKLWEPFLPYLENLRLEMAQENRFLRQINLIVVRTLKRDVMNKIVQSHVSSVRFDLQAEVKALGEKLTDKLDNFMAQIVNHIQRNNEKDGKGMSELEWDDVNISESTIVSRRIDSDVQARELTLRKFNAWLDDPSAGLYNLEIFEASKEWFIDLMTAGMWLSVSHVDVFLHFARKNSHLQSQHLSPSCAIMDTLFWSCMNRRWDAFQHNPDSYNWDSDMLDYPIGKSPKHSRPWSEVESLYLPVNIKNQHWIAVCVDLMRRKLTIYDSTRSQSAPEDEFSFDILKPMATMLPSLLVQSGFYAHRPELNPLSTPFKVVHVEGDIPRQSVSGDCGVFMLKFLEYLSLGKPLNFRQADMALFRKRMALEMFAMNP